MADSTNSGFQLSETDLLVWQRIIDFFASTTISPDDPDAKATFEELAPAWLWDDTNGPKLRGLSFIYDMLMDTENDNGEAIFNFFHGKNCNTDTEIAADAED